ncbi:MAG: tryptophan--tRNA ligase [Alphaproteobacteria bacterium]|nr:tryptophan--tRNA ligase [Alphaproteobacteria bacterium]MCD8571310.1 tryptophan--tRNA ligase [Alphaproteobacteria bacterium]
MKRILSGIQPTNRLHLGNYLGAMRNWVKLQNEPGAECLYMIADLHAITVPQDPESLTRSTRETAAAYIAAGIDPSRSIIFVQSAVPAHSQLMWLLATMAQLGKLERMTQFKDKAGKNAERAGLGLFAYPVLMAADILVYQATHVPVGEDQKQHLELAREIAATFNTRYKTDFLIQPEPVITGPAPRVMSLRDGTQKMSKSAESDMTRINLTDDADAIAQKIRKAKTDAEPLPESEKGLENRPEAKNLVTIYAALADISRQDVLNDFAGKQFSEFKPALSDLAVSQIAPIAARMQELMTDVSEIDALLANANDRANNYAIPVLSEVERIMGIWK